MATHKNYFEIEARTYFELGLRKGELFGDFLHRTLADRRSDGDWAEHVREAHGYLDAAVAVFPHLVDELRGYAQAARAPFDELWSLSLEDEVGEMAHDHCTTVVTNGGSLVAHNEDWDDDAEDTICVLRKRVGDLKMLELYYLNTLGGNAISINSHGYIHAINSLSHKDYQQGVPKTVVARWLSETKSPEADFQQLAKMKRASGYHHTMVGLDNGQIWSIECSATQQKLTKPVAPFIHTNHYLTDLATFEDRHDEPVPGTETRYETAIEKAHDPMSSDGACSLMSDRSSGRSRSIFNERTIARMIVDSRQRTASVWLLREDEKGWISYGIDQTK